MSKKLPRLFKKNVNGSIQFWEIETMGTTISTVYGKLGGKSIATADTIKKGKSVGKKNETSPIEQAAKEAEARWIKQKKKGYVEKIDDAKSGKTDALIEGGVLPMLAEKYNDYKDDVTFPVYVQPKLDGHRCIAVCSAGKVTLWSRTRRPIKSVPHIIKALEEISKDSGLKEFVIDGELYNHKFKKDFEKLTSILRKQKEISEDSELAQYHIYDSMDFRCYSKRNNFINRRFHEKHKSIKVVPSFESHSHEQINNHYEMFLDQGYEGAMVRAEDVGYEHKRTSQLLKMKILVDEEFEIIGTEEGRGKLQQHVGAFICVTKEKKEFTVKLKGPTSRLKTMWKNREDYVGQIMTVQHLGMTKDKKPRGPVGLRIREDL